MVINKFSLPETSKMADALRAEGERPGTTSYNKLRVDVIVCVSLAVSGVHINLPEFPRYFYCLIF